MNDHSTPDDARLYVPHNDGWGAAVKSNSTKEYCYVKSPGDEAFHLLVSGEIYLVKGNEKVCLECALRQGLITHDRLHWQHRTRSERKKVY